MFGGSMSDGILVLRADDVRSTGAAPDDAGSSVPAPLAWRWRLVDPGNGRTLADHPVVIDPAGELAAFTDLYRHLQRNADPAKRLVSQHRLLGEIGAWAGAHLLGEAIGRAILAESPVTLRIVVPASLGFLPQWPWEIAHAGGLPLARQDITVTYDLAPPGSAVLRGAAFGGPRPVGEVLRILAVFSLPTQATALGLRRERRALTDRVRALAARHRVALTVLQYGVTRERLAATVDSGDGWDVLHVSGHGTVGQLALERPDGSPELVDTDDLVAMLRPARRRVKLVVLSACQSAAATTAETLRWLDLHDTAEEFQAAADAEVTSGVRHGTVGGPGGARAGSGLAGALAEALGCAVLAMRYPVSDEFAIRLADGLYERLFDRELPVDGALRRALPEAAGPAGEEHLTDALPPVSLATPALFGGEAAGIRIVPPAGRQPIALDTTMAYFEPEPPRFVGRAGPMARACAALAPASGSAGVIFHGMAGAGKTACALEVAYRHADVFEAAIWWKAPSEPDTVGVAFGQFAGAWEAQVATSGFPSLNQAVNAAGIRALVPLLTTLFRDRALLVVLDNLETLLNSDGAFSDERWPELFGALTGHGGLSRVVLTSRAVPAGLARDRLLVEPVHALALDEAALLARELPDLGALLHADAVPERHLARPGPAQVDADRTLVRRVMGVVQGHPKLLELADAAARAGRGVLEARTAAAEREAAVRGEALAAFFRDGESVLDAGGFFAVLSGWVGTAVAGLPEPAGLALRVVCCLEDDDRTVQILAGNWADIWRRLGLAGDPPPVGVMVGVLAEAALVALDSAPAADSEGGSVSLVGLRVHPGVAEAVRAATPPPVRAAVDEELAAFWQTMSDAALGRVGGEDGRLVAVAGVSAAPYLLRLQEWDQAGSLLEQAFFRDDRNPGMVQAVLPALSRVADATGTPAGLVRFGRVLAVVDPAGGERVLRQAQDRAVAAGDFTVASAAAGELVNLLQDQGRLAEALAVADTTVEYIRRAGLGRWTQALDEARRLQILYRMGEVERVLADLEGPAGLLARLDALPERRDPTDTVDPWNVREAVLQLGALAAGDLGRWEEALAYNARVHASVQARGGSAHEIASTRFGDYGPLLRLGRLDQADRLLADCQQAFTDTEDIPMLGVVFSARADLADRRRRHTDVVRLEQTAVRLRYTRPDPAAVAVSHYNLGNYLTRAGVDPAGALAHHLAAATLLTLVGNTAAAARALRSVADDMTNHPALTPPAGVAELAAVVEHTEGVGFTALIDVLCPDRAAADQTIRDLLAAATDLPTTDDGDVQRHLEAWEPIIGAIAAVASGAGQLDPEADEFLTATAASADWGALVAVLRRILAGERDPAALTAGLDDIDTAIVRTTLTRLSPTSEFP
jgi:tetratricopeptide (TPR) repeat protein